MVHCSPYLPGAAVRGLRWVAPAARLLWYRSVRIEPTTSPPQNTEAFDDGAAERFSLRSHLSIPNACVWMGGVGGWGCEWRGGTTNNVRESPKLHTQCE